jgi:hypothetical protein
VVCKLGSYVGQTSFLLTCICYPSLAPHMMVVNVATTLFFLEEKGTRLSYDIAVTLHVYCSLAFCQVLATTLLLHLLFDK